MADRAPRHAVLHRLIVAGEGDHGEEDAAWDGRFSTSRIGALDKLSVGRLLRLFAGRPGTGGRTGADARCGRCLCAIRLSIIDVADSGATAGRLYAISTAGFLVGTFLAALVFVPFVGTHRTFLLFGFAVALVGALGLRSRRAPGRSAPPAARGHRRPGARTSACSTRRRPLTSMRRVTVDSDGTRSLQLNDSFDVQSIYRAGRWLTNDYWDDFVVLPIAALGPPAAHGRDPRQRRRHDRPPVRALLPADPYRRRGHRPEATRHRTALVRLARPATSYRRTGRTAIPPRERPLQHQHHIRGRVA